MKNPIKNLGDYNTVREDLQSAGGILETLYKNVSDTAVLKAAPKLMFKGGVIATSFLSIGYAGYKGLCFIKNRKQKTNNELVLNEEFLNKDFFETINTEVSENDNSEPNDTVDPNDTTEPNDADIIF